VPDGSGVAERFPDTTPRPATGAKTTQPARRASIDVRWSPPSRLLLIGGLGVLVACLAACASARKIDAEYGHFRTFLDGREVVVSYFEDVRLVRQSAPDLCWAASLEQALAHQGVQIDQQQIVALAKPDAEENEDRSINAFWWRQMLALFEAPLSDGSKVWVRTEIDGWAELAPILSDRTFVRKIGRELGGDRIVLVGISSGSGGGGHVVTVIGAAFPVGVERLTIDSIAGFLVYDPLTGKLDLVSVQQLFDRFVAMFYVTTHDSAKSAITSAYTSTKNVW